MTREEYWQAHVAKNPAFADPETKIEIKVGKLKLLMEEAYSKGYEQANKARSKLDDTIDKLKKKFS